MNKSEMLRFSNLPLALSFLIQAGTALTIFLKIKVPNKNLLFEIHEYNGLALITLATLHIFLNWSWIRVTFFPAKKRPEQPS
ncbi:MAG: DUF4405 domain-containing protein [Candidatus Omnitrophica bacterium]|nr:DUF4405 domain-containing protein [Candidatus Omnitrophota bacterium]